uniref:Retrotransposon gag domain-containing protein n=1 Tax=Trichuris muris TaxID=70415 RepID=A0A5S6QIF2_TRIMR
MPPTTLTTISTTISVPTFNSADPELWFVRLDLFFAQQNVSDEATKLQLAFTGMSDEVLASFRDFIFNATKEAKPFTAFKQLCLKRLTDSKERRIHQALHAEELGDRKPSEFLRYLQQLLERPLSDPILRELFLSRLPNHVRSTLVPFSDLELGQLAELADRVIVHQSTPICAVSQANAATEEKLLRVEKLLEELLLEQRRRPRSPRSSETRRSPTPTRLGRSTMAEVPLCYYHRTFGNRARKCTPPCAADSRSGNAAGQRR